MADRIVFGSEEAEQQKRYEHQVAQREQLHAHLADAAELFFETGITVEKFAQMIDSIWYVFISGDHELEAEWSKYWFDVAERRGALPAHVYEWKKVHDLLEETKDKTVGDVMQDIFAHIEGR
jgi:hypothetical protein